MDTHTVDGQHICTMYSYRSMQGKQQLRMNLELKTLRSTKGTCVLSPIIPFPFLDCLKIWFNCTSISHHHLSCFSFCRRPGTTLRSTERSSADWKHLTGVFLGISSKHLTFSQYQPRRSEIIFPPIASNWGILLALIPQDGVSTNSTW